jgi:PEP-CTERM motif-containing protein
MNMKKSILSFFLFGALLSAAPVSVSFVNGGNPIVNAYGAEVGPYTLSINGHNTPAMCMDDFYQTSGSWTANATSVTSADFSQTYLGNSTRNIAGYTLTSGQIYTAEAYLFSLITQPGADRGDIQEAAWAIMDPTTLQNVFTNSNTQVLQYLSLAASNYSTFNASGYQIISQVNPGRNPQQEFMTATPEPASFALIGAGLLIAGAFRFSRRNKQAEVKS